MPTETAGGHTVTTEPNTSHVVVRTEDGTQTIAESNGGFVLHETGIQDRWYLPVGDVSAELTQTEKTSHCPFKGDATYWSLQLPSGPELVNAAWSYEAPLEMAHAIQGHLSFWGSDVTVEVDGLPVTT